VITACTAVIHRPAYRLRCATTAKQANQKGPGGKFLCPSSRLRVWVPVGAHLCIPLNRSNNRLTHAFFNNCHDLFAGQTLRLDKQNRVP
jgi:hypothetical protein